MRTSIIGCGAFGYALAVLLAKTHPKLEVRVFDVDAKTIAELQQRRRHPYFHTDITTPENISAYTDSAEALVKAELVIMAVPAQIMREAAEGIKEHVQQGAVILNIAKALELGTGKRMSQVVRDVLGEEFPIATLSGGMIAKDAVYGAPVGAEIACRDETVLARMRTLFLPTTVHVETTTDIRGVEYGSAFKNVIAIGAGIVDGLGWGASTKAFFVARSLREIETLAVAMGARHETFHTASNFWMGDLMTTCFGDSRNRLFGELIGRGMTAEEASARLLEQRKHAEGLATLKVVHHLVKEHDTEAPFLHILHEIVYEGKPARPDFERLAQLQDERR